MAALLASLLPLGLRRRHALPHGGTGTRCSGAAPGALDGGVCWRFRGAWCELVAAVGVLPCWWVGAWHGGWCVVWGVVVLGWWAA